MLEGNLSFNIPIFDDMPDSACVKPTGAGDNNYLLSSLSIDGFSLTPNFDTYVNSYELVVDYEVTSINIRATAMSNQSEISGTGTRNLNVGDNTVRVVVTAKTGTQNTYKITVSRREEQSASPDNPPPVIAGDYTVGEYITGISPKTTVSTFIEKLGVRNGTARVFDANSNEKSGDALIGSGDRVTVYRGNDKFAFYETVVYGDINGDGRIASVDLFMGQRYIFGTYELSGARREAADINHDGNVRTVDLFMGQRHIFGTYTIEQ